MTAIHSLRPAQVIFDPEDRFARDRGVRGRHPRPISGLEFLVVGEMTEAGRRPIDPPWKLLVERNPSGYGVFFGQLELPGGRHRAGPGPGTWVVRVESELYQDTELPDVVVPTRGETYSIDLLPSYRYPFPRSRVLVETNGGRGAGAAATTTSTTSGNTGRRGRSRRTSTSTTATTSAAPALTAARSTGRTRDVLREIRRITLLRGGVREHDGRGVAGVRVEADPASYSYMTGADGQWVLVFPEGVPDGEVQVRYRYPDGSVVEVDAVPLMRGYELSLKQTALRGWVIDEAGHGAEGAEIAVGGEAETVKTRADGAWFYYFDPGASAGTLRVTATLSDGRQLSVDGVRLEPGVTVVVPTFRFSQPSQGG